MNGYRGTWRSLYIGRPWILYLLGLLLCLAIVFPGVAQQKAIDRSDCESIDAAMMNRTFVKEEQTGAYRYDNICYADGTHWVEPNPTNSNAKVKLVQRFDFWRPTQVPDKVPLVIYTHPSGGSEDFKVDGPIYTNMLWQALPAGYAVASLEYRHPVSSYDPTNKPPEPPNTDIANAVQFMRAKAEKLKIDPNNIFLVGQSRGSLAILTALLPDQQIRGLNDWRGQSSKVNAVLGYQAQTTYDTLETVNTFINENKQNARCEGSYITWNPGSALQQVANGAKLVPMRLTYDEKALNKSTVVKQCYHQCTPRQPKICKPSICNGITPCKWIGTEKFFDIHDHNYGVALYERYRARDRASLIEIRYNLGGPQGGYDGYINFFNKHLTNPKAAI
jgi:acetyl esterase/lipase